MLTIWERNSLLRQKCSLAKYHHVSTNVTFYHWKNLNYCKVPKCGSTFWMQVFLTLEKIKSVEDVFGSGRNKYHTIAMNKTSTWDHVSSNDVIFHVTRNPYSRLYSVYIDKIYLPGFWKFTKKNKWKKRKRVFYLCQVWRIFGLHHERGSLRSSLAACLWVMWLL